MSEDSVTVMILPEDDTETVLEKVRQAGAKKVSLIVPPGTRSLQTLGGFTMLRKACDITGIEVTVYSEDEKTRDMATVCRFDVVSLDQEVRPRPAPPPEAGSPRIVVSTRPPAPAGEAAVVATVSTAARDRAAGELSADDLALFDALESMSLDEDIELRPGDLGRPAPAVTAAPPPPPRVERPPAKKPKKASPFRAILDPLAGAVASIYIAVVGVFLKVAQRSMQKEAAGAEQVPAALAPAAQTAEEAQALRLRKLRYSLWALVGVVGATILIVGIYALSQPKVFVTLTPYAAEQHELTLAVNIVVTDSLRPEDSVTPEGALLAQWVQVELTGTASLPASGAAVVSEEAATGAIYFVNLLTGPVLVPAGTTVGVSDGGITFHTTQDVWLPASVNVGANPYYGKAIVNVVANQPGSAGNVEAHSISEVWGNLRGVVTVRNEEPTVGGADRQVSIVMDEDHEKLRQHLVESLHAQAYDQLQAQLSGLEVLLGTLEVETLEEYFSHGVGSEATIITLNARVQARALASVPGALDKMVGQVVEEQVSPQAGQSLGEPQISEIGAVASDIGIDSWVYQAHVRVPVLNTITPQLKAEIRASLRGKSYAEAGQVMETYRDQVAAFTISPVVKRLPSIGGLEVVDGTTIDD